LLERVFEIEDLANNKCWEMSAKLAKDLSNKNIAKRSYLANGEPFAMVLECMSAVYLFKYENDERICTDKLNAILNKYKKIASGKRYYCYKYVQHSLRSYYIKNKLQKEAFDLFKDCVLYDIYDSNQISLLIKWGSFDENKKYIPKIIDFFNDLIQNGYTVSPKLILDLIIKTNLCSEEKVELLSKWLRTNFHYSSDSVCKCINEICCVTNSLNTNLIIMTRSLMIDVALKQKNTDDRMSVIASSINTKNLIDDYIFKQNIDIRCNRDKISRLFLSLHADWNIFLNNHNMCSFNLNSIDEMLRYLWSSGNRQRVGNKLSLGQALSAATDVDSLIKRILDKNDDLHDCYKYKHLLLLQGVPGRLYWFVERLFWRSDYDKAYRLLNFLLLPENNDGFVIGASKFYLGRMLHELNENQLFYDDEKRNIDALKYLLAVPIYPTCLTYISYAYIMASEILFNENCFNSAVLLCMIDVPSIDYISVKQRKHQKAINYSLAACSLTNYVKNLQECLRFSNEEQSRNTLYFNAKKKVSKELWDYCNNNPINEFDRYEILQSSLEEISSLENNEIEDLFYHAVTKKWPNAFSLPQNIATNRLLNNNVF